MQAKKWGIAVIEFGINVYEETKTIQSTYRHVGRFSLREIRLVTIFCLDHGKQYVDIGFMVLFC